MNDDLKKNGFSLPVKDRVERTVAWMAEGVYEKEHIAAMALLCAVAGENIFLLGPPGTAKSLVARRLKGVFSNARSFEYLMSRFSTPDEIFGPISISRLKNDDVYERLTAGYLPSADVVFLDEIWKAGPSIQNTLLTAINEHVYQNGSTLMKLPMKTLIAASNELPPAGEGLEALWDRFLVRMVSNCIEDESNFERMLSDRPADTGCLAEELSIKAGEYERWSVCAGGIEAGEDVMACVKFLRRRLRGLDAQDAQAKYYVSDRRWKKVFRLMKTSAFLNDRSHMDRSDIMLMMHCLWSVQECRPDVINCVAASLWHEVAEEIKTVNGEIQRLISPDDRTKGIKEVPESDYSMFYNSYYAVENYLGSSALISKWDYGKLSYLDETDGVEFLDSSLRMTVLQIMKSNRVFDLHHSLSGRPAKVRMLKCGGGIVVNGVPYALARKKQSHPKGKKKVSSSDYDALTDLKNRVAEISRKWNGQIQSILEEAEANIFVSLQDVNRIREAAVAVSADIVDAEIRLKNLERLMS